MVKAKVKKIPMEIEAVGVGCAADANAVGYAELTQANKIVDAVMKVDGSGYFFPTDTRDWSGFRRPKATKVSIITAIKKIKKILSCKRVRVFVDSNEWRVLATVASLRRRRS